MVNCVGYSVFYYSNETKETFFDSFCKDPSFKSLQIVIDNYENAEEAIQEKVEKFLLDQQDLSYLDDKDHLPKISMLLQKIIGHYQKSQQLNWLFFEKEVNYILKKLDKEENNSELLKVLFLFLMLNITSYNYSKHNYEELYKNVDQVLSALSEKVSENEYIQSIKTVLQNWKKNKNCLSHFNQIM